MPNQPPTLSNVATLASFTEEGGAVTLANAISVSDPDDLNLASATVAVAGSPFAFSVLAAATAGTNIAAFWNGIDLELVGSDTLANYQKVLDSVTFDAGENPSNFDQNPTRAVTWTINDGNSSSAVTTTLSLTNVNDPPTLSLSPTVINWTEGDDPVSLASIAGATDPDNLSIASATVSIVGGTFAGDGDVRF